MKLKKVNKLFSIFIIILNLNTFVNIGILAESFYYVKYGSSIITSKIPSKIFSNENKKMVFPEK